MFVVHRAESGEVLAEEPARLLADPLEDPLCARDRRSTREGRGALVGAAPLTALRDIPPRRHRTRRRGVCERRFPSPRQLLQDAAAESSPVLAEQLAMWAPPRLTWSVRAALDENLNEDWCRLPRQYLFPNDAGEDEVPDRRLGFAARVARLFDTYAHSRPAMLARWATDEYVRSDGSPVAVPEQWQPASGEAC
ncbi:exodeoxyribonuclease V subunit gamma [Microbacterium shaanxiense]